ncbi:ABC transporter ATP-binding protein [Paenibacillus aquistagni]|uniref:Oligopeptide transport system ATP-binding protein n=1 Tax=Paenibacillus aquistagni TaxID=1852522 RepID=A0A1X7JZ68_9BACL|nr:ABC transporter ATP-binding protein [Paenibacillus aquistagni]SMG33755.1 oligopeptide transport system ATP-binding protein [Paenibacillus aquistagni]
MRNVMEIEHLSTYFYTREGAVKAVNDISFRIREGETVCIVGESGSGKSVTALSVMGLIEEPAGKIVEGQIHFDGKQLLNLSKQELRTIRGNDIAMIFQEPMSSLNPVIPIGKQIMEPLKTHQGLNKKEAKRRAIELIELVGISRPEQIAESYPHQLSGGMLQRVMIAMAISCEPKLLIADEPTTALDVTIQAQILDMLDRIKQKANMSMLLITHDLGVVAEIADYVIVMYSGKIVEEGEVVELFDNPKHPYTQGLLRSKPIIGDRQDELYSIPGQVPNPLDLKESCYFHDRCEHCLPICKTKLPQLKGMEGRQRVACWLYEEGTHHD